MESGRVCGPQSRVGRLLPSLRTRVVGFISLLMRLGGVRGPLICISFACLLQLTPGEISLPRFLGTWGEADHAGGGQSEPPREIKTSSATVMQTNGGQTIPGGTASEAKPWSPHARARQGKRQTRSRDSDLGSSRAGPVLHTPRAPVAVDKPPGGLRSPQTGGRPWRSRSLWPITCTPPFAILLSESQRSPRILKG